jgi:putative transposase
MSNHYHLIIETPNGNLSQIMKHINSSYTTYYNIKRKRSGHLLQGRYKAILIDGDAYATELSRYIHLNPVRAGIVSVPEDYPWMSYRYYIGEKTPDWLTTGFIQGYFSKDIETAREKYKLFVHDLINQVYQSPLLETVASTILGRPEFVRATQERHLNSRKADRDLPALRELTSRLSLNDIVVAVKNVFPDNARGHKGSDLRI